LLRNRSERYKFEGNQDSFLLLLLYFLDIDSSWDHTGVNSVIETLQLGLARVSCCDVETRVYTRL